MCKRWVVFPLLALALGLTACGRQQPTGGGWANSETVRRTGSTQSSKTYQGQGASPDVIQKVVKPPPNLPPLKSLKLTLPNGWASTYLERSNEWRIDKREPKKSYHIFVARAPTPPDPPTLAAYTQHIRNTPDEAGHIFPTVLESGALPDGFFIVARTRLAADVTNKDPQDVGFIIIRNIKGDRFRFKCHLISDEARPEALGICRGAQF